MNSQFILRALTGLALSAALAVPAAARTWTNHEGKQIEADYVRLDGLNVVLKMKGREVPVPLANLSEADKQFVFQQQLGGAAPGAESPFTPVDEGSSPAAESADETSAESSTSTGSPRASGSKGVARVRNWKDAKGNNTRAKFVRLHDGNVVLMQGTKAVTCPIDQLSPEDLEYLRELLNARGEANLLPTAEELAASRQAKNNEGGGGGAGYAGGAGIGGAGFSPTAGMAGGGYSPAGAGTGTYAGGAASSSPYTVGGAGAASASPYSAGAGASASPTYGGAATAGSPYTSSAPYDVTSAATTASPGADPAAAGSTGYGAYPGAGSTTGSPYTSSGAGSSPYGAGMGAGANPAATDMASASTGSPYSGGMTGPQLTPNTGPAFNPGSNWETSIGGQQELIEYHCSACGKIVPAHINDKCPHCGIRFDYVENPDGTKTYNGHYIFGSIGTVIAVIVGVVIRLAVAARR